LQTVVNLQDIWIRCFADLGAELPHDAFADVTQRYREAHRACPSPKES